MNESMTSEDVRRHNLGLVMAQLAERPLSRSDLARATGLVRGSLTSLSAELIDAGLVRTSDVIPAAGRGRPSTLLEIAADDVATITAMLDADHAVVAVSSLSGDDIARIGRRHGRPLGDPDAVMDVLAAVIDEALTAAAAAGRVSIDLTVVVWAPVTGDTPVVRENTALGWGETDLIAMLGARIPRLQGAPISLVSDTTVAAREEYALIGSPRDAVYLKADSGIGGALFVGGRPLDEGGRRSDALGHLPIVADGLACGCGRRGCVETVAGADALIRAAGLTALALDEGQDVALETFLTAVWEGEPRAQAVWDTARAHIVRALQILTMTLAPSDIVLGGYLAPFADDIAADLAAGAASAAPTVHASELGADAALRGAERTARARVIDLLLG